MISHACFSAVIIFLVSLVSKIIMESHITNSPASDFVRKAQKLTRGIGKMDRLQQLKNAVRGSTMLECAQCMLSDIELETVTGIDIPGLTARLYSLQSIDVCPSPAKK